MIGRNETPSKKAKFWQSYVRSLKGMRTFFIFFYDSVFKFIFSIFSLQVLMIFVPMKHQGEYSFTFLTKFILHSIFLVQFLMKMWMCLWCEFRVSSWRPLSADLPLRSIYDEPSTASERITGAGYRYLPVHRETYGYSPRPIYSHHYGRPSEFSFLFYQFPCFVKINI